MFKLRTETFATPLKEGDEIQVVAASSVVNNKESLEAGLKVFKSWGLVCQEHNVLHRQWGYLAGDDKTRFEELHPKNTSPLIAFARGGWGAARLLEKSQPWKSGFLVGFSDVSSLLLDRVASGFDGAIHGPLITSLAKEPRWSKERLKALLFGESVPTLYGSPWAKGIAEGPLIIANLTVATHLLGSRHLPDLKGAILIIEDIGEAPYRIDRMLTQWRLAGVLQNLAGLGFGSFVNCHDVEDSSGQPQFNVEDVLRERSRDLQIPIIGDLPIGHICGNASMPLGRKAIFDANKGSISVFTEDQAKPQQ